MLPPHAARLKRKKRCLAAVLATVGFVLAYDAAMHVRHAAWHHRIAWAMVQLWCDFGRAVWRKNNEKR